MSVYGDQYFDLCPNRVIRNPITNDMDLRKQVLGFLPLHIQDPTNATKNLSTEKAMPMVDVAWIYMNNYWRYLLWGRETMKRFF